jgi:hypothetical protein
MGDDVAYERLRAAASGQPAPGQAVNERVHALVHDVNDALSS